MIRDGERYGEGMYVVLAGLRGDGGGGGGRERGVLRGGLSMRWFRRRFRFE